MDFDRSGNNHSGKYYDGFINENKQLYNGNHIIIIINFIVENIFIYNVFFVQKQGSELTYRIYC